MIDTSRFAYERYRERMDPSYQLKTFCTIEHFDEAYLWCSINLAQQKREAIQFIVSLGKKLVRIAESR
ncbi:MAG: hypothetical protein VB025_12655 [Sphaerochaeta sp.]|nr:hypothetical protein [Sphaerochaeta sp.]